MTAKVCKVCGVEQGNAPWKMKRGKPEGLRCAACESIASSACIAVRKADPIEKEKLANYQLAYSKTSPVSRSINKSAKKAIYTEQRRKDNANSYARKYRSTPAFKAERSSNMTSRIRLLIATSLANQGYTKRSKAFDILGASHETVVKHLVLTASFGRVDMAGIPDGYEIDHIIPMAVAFDEASAIRLNHYTNLQLLTAEANAEKSDWVNGVRARNMTLEQKKEIIKELMV